MDLSDYKFSQAHEWVRLDSAERATVGITEYAQSEMGDIVFVELTAPGTELKQFARIGEIESVKAVAEFFSPVSGAVLETNRKVEDEPQLVNQDPYGDGWLIKLKASNSSELDSLMSDSEYEQYVEKLKGEQEA